METLNFAPVIFDEENENSLKNLVQPWAWEKFNSVPKEYLDMDMTSLRGLVRPGLTVEALRASFWVEYNYAVTNGKKMNISRIHAGLCTDRFFYHSVMNTHLLLAWVLRPPEQYVKSMEAILLRSTERLYDIVNQEFYVVDKQGNARLDPRVMHIVLQAHQHIEARVKGSIVNKNLNLNVNKQVAELQESELEDRVKELRAREARALGFIGAGEVTEEAGQVKGD